MPSLLPHAGSDYRPELDSIRALAVIFVIINHFDERVLPSGFLGVDMFFVLSGYVVTASLHGRPMGDWRAFVLAFYARRIKRIFPALIFCVLLTAFVGCFFIQYPVESLKSGMYALVAASNLFFFSRSSDYFGEDARHNLFTHTWSLGVEEQFYLLFPVLLVLIGFSRPNRLLLTVVTLSLGSYVLWSVTNQTSPSFSFYMMPARFWELGLGCAAFLVSTTAWSERSNKFAPQASFAALAAIFIAVVLPIEFLALSNTAICLAVAVLALATRTSHAVTRAMSFKWLVRIGVLSYSLYLWHWSVIALSRHTIGISAYTVVFQALLIFLLALFSFVYVERPLRYSKLAKNSKRVVLVGVSSVVISLGLLTQLNKAPNILFSADQARFDISRPIFPLEPSFEQCIVGYDFDKNAHPPSCYFENKTGSGHALWMVGDSTTWALKGLASKVSERTGLSIYMFADDSAFPITGSYKVGPKWDGRWPSIRDFHQQAFTYVKSHSRAGDLVLITADLAYEFCHQPELYCPNSAGQTHVWRDIHGNPQTFEQALHSFLREMGELNDYLASKGVHLIIKAPLPRWEREHRIYCERQWYRPEWENERCFTPAVGAQLESRARLVSVLGDASEAYGFLIYDPFPFFCNSRSCRFSNPETNENYWVDETHLSTSGGAHLADHFLQFLKSHGLVDAADLQGS